MSVIVFFLRRCFGFGLFLTVVVALGCCFWELAGQDIAALSKVFIPFVFDCDWIVGVVLVEKKEILIYDYLLM